MAQTIAESIWEEGLRKGLELGVEEGRRQGREEGRQQGRVKGELELARRLLWQLLVKRFGAVPDDVVQRIASATDAQMLAAAVLQVWEMATPQDLPP